MEILISDFQDEVPLDLDLMKRLAQYIIAVEGNNSSLELSISFVSQEEIKKLNRRYRGIDSSTDVLSFFLQGGFDATPDMLGEVIVAPRVAAEQAHENNQSLERELCLLLAHGVLHLLGYSHENPSDEFKMRSREAKILNSFFSYGINQDEK